MDNGATSDVVILTADGISILYGQRQNAGAIDDSSRLENINLPFVPQAIAVGDFIFDRAKLKWQCSRRRFSGVSRTV